MDHQWWRFLVKTLIYTLPEVTESDWLQLRWPTDAQSAQSCSENMAEHSCRRARGWWVLFVCKSAWVKPRPSRESWGMLLGNVFKNGVKSCDFYHSGGTKKKWLQSADKHYKHYVESLKKKIVQLTWLFWPGGGGGGGRKNPAPRVGVLKTKSNWVHTKTPTSGRQSFCEEVGGKPKWLPWNFG